MMRESDTAGVFGILAEPMVADDCAIEIDVAVIGAVSDVREIGDEDIEAEDVERREGRLAFTRKEEATA